MDQWGRYDPAVDDLEVIENEDLRSIAPGKRSLTSPLTGPASGSVPPGKVTRSLGVATELPFQADMEAAFGQDFSTVNSTVTTPEALGGSKGMAQGENVAFSSASPSRQTVAHELAHVVQHRQGLTEEAHADDDDTPLDRAANAMAAAAANVSAAFASTHTARARLPRPVVMEVIGDRFTVSLAATATNELSATITYQGPYLTGGEDVRNGAVQLTVKRAANADQGQPLNTQVLMVKADGLVLDLMGNGQEIAEIRFNPAGHEDDADARTHTITSWTNGDPAPAAASINILLPTEGRPAPEGLSPEEQARIRKATASINLGPDTFTLSARRLGESNRVHLHFNSTNHSEDGYGANLAMEVPTATAGPVTLVLLSQSETGFEADLDGDGHADIRVVHTARTSTPRSDGSQDHTHFIDIYDLNGTRVDRTWFVVTGEEWNVPAAIDRELSPPPDSEPASGATAPMQSDLPTEATEPTRLAGGDYELRVDSDGDRYKDLVIRISHPRPTDRIGITISQISSGKSVTITTPGDELNAIGTMNPRIVRIADGRNPLDILLYHQPNAGPGTHLYIDPPTDIDRGRVFDFRVSNLSGFERRSAALFDHETETHDEVSLASGVTPTAARGNIPSFTARLGELGDPFLFTLEATSNTYTLGVSGLNDGAPAVSAGFTIRPIENQNQFRPVSIGASFIGIDLTNNGEPDIFIHDGIGAPPEGLASPELLVERVHQMSLSGAAAQGEQSATFLLRGRHFQRLTHGQGDAAGRLASGAAAASATFAQQEAEGHELDILLGRYQAGVSAQILQAGERGFISNTLVSTWRSLAEEMVRLDAYAKMSDKPEEVANNERSVRESAAEHATTLYEELARETAGAIETTHYEDADTHSNPYTGAQFRNPGTYDEAGNRQDNFIETFAGPAAQLAEMLRTRRDDRVAFLWSSLQSGVERWAQKRLEEELGEDDPLVKQGRYMASMSEQLGLLRGKRNVQRVSASFIADESNRDERDFFPSMPLQLWVWEDEEHDGLWHLCDLTNPTKKFEGEARHPYRRVNAAGDQSQFEPPHTLFQQLNDKKKFPKGLIRYQIAGGQAGQVVCEANKKWYEWVQEIGLGLAAIGLGLVTFGTGTVAVAGSYVLAASALAGAVAAGGEIADAAAHGWLDGTVLMINLLQIASSVASAGAIVAGNLARGAAAASNAVRAGQQGATLWSGNLAKLAAMGGKVYVPLTGTALVADAATVVVMSVDLMNKLKEIDDNISNEEEANAAKVRLLAMFALTGGLTALSVKGDLPVIREGRINIVLDTVGGVPVAHAGGVRLGNAEIPVSRVGADGAAIPDANLHATARWQNPEARARLSEDDVEWYQAWMRQDPKVRIGRGGEIEVIMPHIEGKTPPAGLEDRLKSIAESSDMAMLDSAWARTSDLEALREANGGNLDIDPTSPAWVQERPRLKDQLTESLGSRRRAEEVLSSYEAIRTGVHGPGAVAHADQARRLSQILPESEVEAVRRMFPEYEVYVSGDALGGADSAAAISKVEVVVVVPNGTESDLMGAIEQRASATRLRPDPDYAQAHPATMDQNSTLGVEARVVTQDQFFGLATARVRGQAPLDLHRLDIPTGPGGRPYTTAELESMNRAGYQYDPATGQFAPRSAATRAGLEGSGTALRGASGLRGENVVLGDALPSEAIGQEVLRKLSMGDAEVLRVVGIEPPANFDPRVKEWGLGQRADGSWVLIEGEGGAVNWGQLPGIRPRGHVHPIEITVRGQRQQRLLQGPGGREYITVDELVSGQAGGASMYLCPSGSDLAMAAREGRHMVATPYVHLGGGRIGNPSPDGLDPPVEFDILSSRADGLSYGDTNTVFYKAQIRIRAGDEILYQGSMWGAEVNLGIAEFPDIRFQRPGDLRDVPADLEPGVWRYRAPGDAPGTTGTPRTTGANPDELELARTQTADERQQLLGTDPKRGYVEQEGEVGPLIESRYGYFKRDPSGDGEWISLSGPYEGKTFDLVGVPASRAHYVRINKFNRSITSHFLKSIDYIVVDIRHFTPDQQRAVREYLDANHAGDSGRLILLE